MIKLVHPKEAEALIAAGGLDVVDVREPHEYAAGHVPGARNVPLGQLRANPQSHLPKDKVLLVCERGPRSHTAAAVAAAIGLQELYDLEGGTSAWRAAGLPVETPAPPEASLPTRTMRAPPAAPEAEEASPEPALDVIVGENMRALRAQRNLSLDDLARSTGLSRNLLGQIELGKTAPSVSVVWRIAQAFGVHFSALLATAASRATSVLRRADAKRLVSPDGRYSSRPLYPFAEKPDAEFYELYLAGHSREDARPHQPGTRENLIVTSGKLELILGSERFELSTGDAILFTADVPHSYVNHGAEECWMYLVMTYAAGRPPPAPAA